MLREKLAIKIYNLTKTRTFERTVIELV